MYLNIDDIKHQKESILIKFKLNNYTLWYQIPKEYYGSDLAESLICSALFPAMVKNENIVLDSVLYLSSIDLLHNIDFIQNVFSTWNKHLAKIQINCNIKNEPKQKMSDIASFFSGGIDSLFTLSQHCSVINSLIYINGFDFQLSDKDFKKNIERFTAIADYYNVSLLPINTNYNEFMYRNFNISRALHQASCFASIGHLLNFKKIIIPSSYTYNQLHPWGSHPLTDSYWSSGNTVFIHDDASHKRSFKTKSVFLDQKVAESVHVCWKNSNVNCGKCSKCVRTNLVLKILNLKNRSLDFPLPLSSLAKLRCESLADLSFYQDNLELAKHYKFKYVIPLYIIVLLSAFKLYVKSFDENYLSHYLNRIYKLLTFKSFKNNDSLVRPKN